MYPNHAPRLRSAKRHSDRTSPTDKLVVKSLRLEIRSPSISSGPAARQIVIDYLMNIVGPLKTGGSSLRQSECDDTLPYWYGNVLPVVEHVRHGRRFPRVVRRKIPKHFPIGCIYGHE